MRSALLLLALALVACEPQIIERTIYVDAPAVEAPAAEEPAPPAEPALPVWVPEPWHVYVLDSADVVRVDEEARPEGMYLSRLQCWRMQCEVETNAHPADPWRAVGGGML